MTQRLGALTPAMIDHALNSKPTRITARVALLRRLKGQLPLAVHELNIENHSQNALATELSTMARLGLVQGQRRHRKQYKEWFLTPDGERAV